MKTLSSNSSCCSNSEQYSEYNLDAESKYFIICKSCFWCASRLNRSNMITKCPMCDNNNDGLLDSIPISDNLVYKIDYGKNVELL
jgi:hypothetical protein